MVILESPPIVSEILDQSGIKDEPAAERGEEVAHWFYGVPSAGVKYYSFENRPTPQAREPQPASGGAP